MDLKYDDKLIFRLLLSLMPAAIVIMLSNSLNSIVDGIIASNYIGNDALAVIGYYTPFTSLLTGVSTIFAGGALIITGNCLGKGDEKGAGTIFTVDTIVVSVLMLLITIVMLCFAPAAAALFGAKGAVRDDVVSYIRGIAFSFLPLFLGNHLGQFLELEQRHARNYISIAMMLALNVILNLFFIKVLRLGCFGLGLATTVSCWIYFIILVQYYFTKKAQLRFDFSLFDLTKIFNIAVIGLPGALVQIYLCIRGYVYNQSIIYYTGEEGMAAFAAVNSFSCIFYAFTYGIATASRTLFSLFAGARDRKSIRTTMKLSLVNLFAIDVGISCIFCMLSGVFAGIYFNDTQVAAYELAMDLFKIVPFAVSFSAVGSVFSALYQCESSMKVVNAISLMDGLLGVCISILLLCPFFGINGVWYSWFTNNLCVMAVIFVYTVIRLKRLPGKLEDWLGFADDFGTSQDMRLNLAVHNSEEAAGCSNAVIDFLKNRGVDNKRAFYTGLALEEMACNIVQHGYKRNKKNNAVIECIDLDDKLVLHIMDDCAEFNPLSKDLIFDINDPSKNIGIRLVQGIADEIKYYRMMGINVLTIVMK